MRNLKMKKLKDIDKKIEDLKKKKESLEAKAALHLFKKLKTILGDEFSPELVMGMMTHTWENKNPKMKEVWLQKSSTFHPSQKHEQADQSYATID